MRRETLVQLIAEEYCEYDSLLWLIELYLDAFEEDSLGNIVATEGYKADDDLVRQTLSDLRFELARRDIARRDKAREEGREE